jgi:hypothetical protein
MKIADILRRLADNIDGHSQGGQPDPALQNPAELQAVPTGQNIVVVDTDADNKPSPNGTTASGNDREPEELFLPPLQQKQELLKKAVGVENIYDDGRPGEQGDANADAPTPEQEDLLDRIKRMAGVPAAAIQELSNDEVFDD